MPPQLEKNHVVPTAWQDEALARDGVSGEVPCSALKGETVPDPVFLPGKPHGQRSLVDYSPWSHKRVRQGFVAKQTKQSILHIRMLKITLIMLYSCFFQI